MDITRISIITNMIQGRVYFYKDTISIWFWVALAELFLILLLLLLLLKTKKRQLEKKTDLKTKVDVDMNNLVNSIAKSQKLYEELSRQCHPDRFVNTNLQSTAEELFQEISRNKRNYQKMIELKQIAIKKLNITNYERG